MSNDIGVPLLLVFVSMLLFIYFMPLVHAIYSAINYCKYNVVFSLSQYKWYRALVGGVWYKVYTNITYGGYWCKAGDVPNCCGSSVVYTETYPD